MKSYFFKAALLADGWSQDVRVEVVDGYYQTVTANSQVQSADQRLDAVIAAMPNVHSHVFQRQMSGLSEYKTGTSDSFWSWRQLMYELANQVDDEQLYQQAKQSYREMQQAGYGSVCEFHYVHRDISQAENSLNMSKAVMQAAADVGLPLLMLPVFYAFSAVGDKPLQAHQQRFGLSVKEYLHLFEQLEKIKQKNQQIGLCFHSIRAANQQQMQELIKHTPDDRPIHIHIAEQQAEIEQSLDYYQQRPVNWLYQNFEVNQRWCLVHATHLSAEEIEKIARSKAVVGLCPLTEANLGDGVFPMPEFKQQQGRWAIGSDSNIEFNPAAELKMLEYSQRLKRQQRNICCDLQHNHVGTWQWLQAIQGGAQVSALPIRGIAPQQLAQVMVLKTADQRAERAEQQLDSWVFSDFVQAESLQL